MANIEESGRGTELLYRQFIEQVAGIFYTAEYGENGRWLYVSPQIEKLLGFTIEEWQKDPGLWYEQLHPEDREHTIAEEMSSLQTGKPLRSQYRLFSKDRKRIVWFLDDAKAVLDPSGKPYLLQGVMYDITSLKNTQEELRRSEERFRSTFNNAPIGMAIVDLNRRFLQVNPAFCDLLGFQREQLLRKTLPDLTPKEETGQIDLLAVSRQKQGHTFSLEQRYIRADGTIMWGQLHIALVVDKSQHPLYFLLQIQDITDRKGTEDLLRISGDRFRALIENASDVITVVDTDGYISFSSPSTQRVLGYTLTEYLGTNFFEKVHPDDKVWVRALFTEMVNSGGGSFVAEFRYKHLNDDWRWIELKATNAMADHSVGGVIANYRDITDTRNAKEAIQTRAAQQSVLAEMSQRALVETNLSVLMNDIVDRIAETLRVEYCTILELMPGADFFVFRASLGWEKAKVGKYIVDNNPVTLAGYTLSSRAPVFLEDWSIENRFSDGEMFLQQGIVCGMSVPIEGWNIPYGVLDVHSTRHRSFTRNDIHFLQAMANVLGAAVGRVKADEALRNSEERYMLVARGANDGLWDWNLKTNDIYYSPRWKEMLGYTDDELANDIDEWLRRVHPVDLERVKTTLSPNLNSGELRFETEFRILHKDGFYLWALNRGIVIRDQQGIAHRMAGSLTDITERKLAEQQLQFDAFHDALTRLANRAYLTDRLTHVINISRRKKSYRFAVLFLDLDEFKVVNDRFGHGVGDQFLIEVSHRLVSRMRSTDTLARLGGDEFVILLEDINEVSEAIRVAERVQAQLSEVFDLAGVKITASASIGIVSNDFFPYESSEEILRDADIAMYSAKTSGKAHYHVFSLSLREQTIIRLEREVDLRHALERNQFRVYYQPIYSFVSKQPTGVEALLRWKHPTQGLIMPSEFIKIAEESNLIIPIDCYVLREACLQVRRWEKRYPAVGNWTVHVNLSSKHFAQPNLVETIKGIIQETGFDFTRVNIEITESAIMENIDLATLTTRRLRDFGIHIGIDDFGTGYASLNYLTRFPVDVLKLDMSFVARILIDSNTREIIDTVVKLASKLGIKVVAEGVETVEQMSVLHELGCEFGQGYLFSRPIDRDAVADMVSQKP